MQQRKYNFIDTILMQVDRGVRTVFSSPKGNLRSTPDASIAEPLLTPQEAREASRLMRVNHAGEVAAQALYQGQALVATTTSIQKKLQTAAEEESDHLFWCAQRIQALGGRLSYLNLLWYLGSFGIGAMAGLQGDAFSLGFLAETERQVCQHLQNHLDKLPAADIKSKKIIEQMQEEEAQHATLALSTGARELPSTIKYLMRLASKVMTNVAYWI